MRKLDARQLAREKSLFRYSSALERADFGTVETVLREAERDPLLAQMITEINMVYESETLRLSPSLNHSSNHREKELLLTTIVIPSQQRNMQRWLPITLAAACVSVLFIGALMLRPIRPNGTFEAGLQAGSTGTPTAAASPTLVPTQLPTFTPTPAPASGVVEATVVPPADVLPAIVLANPTCASQDAVIISPSSNTVVAGTVTISGIATASNFGSYKLEIIGLGTGGKYISLADGTQAVASVSALGQIDLSSYPPQNYGIRLSVFDASQQLQGRCLVNITLARAAAIPDVIVSNSAAATLVPINLLPSSAVVKIQTFTHSAPAANGTLGMTLTPGVVVYIDQQSKDGQWSHVVLDGGKNGWVLSSTLQLQMVSAVNGLTASTQPLRGIIGTTSTLYELPNIGAKSVGVAQMMDLVTIGNTSIDGSWSYVTLQDGKQGWMISGFIRPNIGATGIVNVDLTVLRDKPDANANMIRTLQHNVTLTIYTTSEDGKWANVVLPDTTQGWVLVSDLQSEVLFQGPATQPNVLCSGQIGTQPAQLFSRASDSGVILGTLQPGMYVMILDFDNQSGNSTGWYYGQSYETNSVGWIKGSDITSLSYCAQPSSPHDQFSAVVTMVPTIVAAGVVQPIIATVSNGTVMVTVVPANPILVPTVIQADVQPAFSAGTIPSCSAVTLNGTTAHVINQLDKAATIYAEPLTSNSNASVVGTFPAKSEAVLLYQQYDHQSAPIGALWYLITINNGSDKQLTGWISANGINSSDGWATQATGVSVPVPMQVPTQAEVVAVPVPSEFTTNIVPIGICTLTTPHDESIPVFSGPEESLIVNNLPPSMPATVLYQRPSQQTGVTWYLILAVAKEGKEVSGWVSSDSVKIVGDCPSAP